MNDAPIYASMQAYWTGKFPQVVGNYVIPGKWFVTVSLARAQSPKIGHVFQVLIVQAAEGNTVYKLCEIGLQGDINVTQEADRAIQMVLSYTNAKPKVKNPLLPQSTKRGNAI